jgi:hypothetical protein
MRHSSERRDRKAGAKGKGDDERGRAGHDDEANETPRDPVDDTLESVPYVAERREPTA